jgi:SAM-dependent methyltransferase
MKIDWWENFFHGIALDFWRAVISDEQTAAEAAFIHTHLQLPIGARILDVPCGNGRLSLRLGEMGFRPTGVDIAEEFIAEARTKATERGVDAEWHQREMRNLPWSNEFDGAFCFGNSFGYQDDEGNAESLKVIARTLKPGARFILDAPAIAECLLPSLQTHRRVEVGGMTVEMETRYDAEQRRMFNDFSFTRNGQTDQRSSSQRIYSYQELKDLLAQSGLQPVADYSSLTGDRFESGSPRLLTVWAKV